MKKNNYFKRIASMLIAMLLLIGSVPAALAADTVSVSLSVDKNNIKPGDIVTVTLSLDNDVDSVQIADFFINYDNELFARNSSSVGTAMSGVAVTDPDIEPGKISINVFDASGSAATAGTIATVSFVADEDVSESSNATFSVTYDILQDVNFNDLPVTLGAPVSVNIAPESVEAGYTVTMPTDIEVTGYQKVQIPVTVGHTDTNVETFNAFDMTFTYDEDMLDLVTTEITGLTVTTSAGTVRVQGYGQDRDLGTAFTLDFMATDVGTSSVTVESAKVDISANAISADAPEASKIDSATNITVNAYEVTLPEDFEGEGTARPGESYTFTAKDLFYIYEISATMGGTSVAVTDNGNGTYTITNVSGAIVITATKTPKTFDVTINGEDLAGNTGEGVATYMTDYVATLTPIDGFKYEVTVTIAGEEYTGYTTLDNVYTIPGADIRGDIVFTVVKTQNDGVTVTVNGPSGEVVGESSVIIGTDYEFTVNEQEGYEYDITATMDGESVEIIDNGDGTYMIKDVTGPIVITVTKTLSGSVEVKEYIDLNGRTMFLVLVSGTLTDGNTYAYDGQVMYFSNQYNAYAYLTIVDSEFTADTAKEKVNVVQGSSEAYSQTYDVNCTDLVDINDAQLTYDMYNAKYQDFDTVNMQKFLNADNNNDKKVDTTDAAAIVDEIQ